MSLLRAIFGDLQPGEYIELRFIGPRKDDEKPPRRQFFCSSVEEAQRLVSEAEHNQWHIYYGVAPRSRKEGTKDAVKRITTLWADLDAKDFIGGKAGAHTAAMSLVLPPSFVIDSGHGYHAYWLLDTPWPPKQVEPVLRVLADAVHGGHVTDSSRVMRVPGTLNIKDPDAHVDVTVVRAREDLRYSLEDLLAATKVSETGRRLVLTGDATSFKSRSERDFAVIRELKRLGMSDGVIHTLYVEQPIGDKFREAPQEGEPYLKATLENAAKQQVSPEDLAAYFIEEDECYWVITKAGNKRVSTFVFEPTRLLQGDKEDVLLGDIRASGFLWPNIPLTKKAFNRGEALLNQLPIASWQWLGTDKEVRRLLPYLMQKLLAKGLPKAKSVRAIGRHGAYWVTPSGALTVDAELTGIDAPVVYLKTGREIPRVAYAVVTPEEYKDLLTTMCDLLPKVNLPKVIWPIIGWFMATPLKPVLAGIGVRFPVLNLYGTRGAGKTSVILRVMQPLIGHIEPRSYDCNTTQFVLLALLASTNAVPIAFSEFRRTALAEREYAKLRKYVLLAYDVGHDPRGRADQTTVDYPLSAPFTLDGEDAFSDPAALERTIVVNMRPESIHEGSEAWEAYMKLVEKPLHQFAGRYVRSTLQYGETELTQMWKVARQDIVKAFPSELPDRVRRNITVCWMGIKLLNKHVVAHGFPAFDVVPEVLQGVVSEVVHPITGRTYTFADEFVEDVINAIALLDRAPFFFRYEEPPNVLWFHLSTALAWWHAKRRREGRTLLDQAAIKAQLRERGLDLSIAEGQYIVGRKSLVVGDAGAKWMYGVSIGMAVRSGLDIPSKLTRQQVIISYDTTTVEEAKKDVQDPQGV